MDTPVLQVRHKEENMFILFKGIYILRLQSIFMRTKEKSFAFRVLALFFPPSTPASQGLEQKVYIKTGFLSFPLLIL